MNIHQVKFTERTDRIRFAHTQFENWMVDSVLDVGCDTAPLRAWLPGVRYFGIDIGGEPDRVVNLEETERLPFDDASFRTVVCFEVLEHLDSLHGIFAELFRVAETNVIVSLPNCWCSARRPLERGTGAIAHYGLPVDPVVDRHKWFLSATDIVDFFSAHGERMPGVRLEEIIGAEKPRPGIVRSLRRLRHGPSGYLNRYVHTVFARFSLGN